MRENRILASLLAAALASLPVSPATLASDAGGATPDAVPASLAATEALLSGNRVKATVTWKNPYSGQSGTATAVSLGDEFAGFSFSTPENPEVFVKALGSNQPGTIQLFASGLTSFEYAVTFAGCGQTRVFTKKATENVTYQDGAGIPSAGCAPWSNEVVVTLPGGVALTMLRIPAGTFTEGSPAAERGRESDEGPRSVTLTADWYMGKTEVTQAQWQAVTGTHAPTECGIVGTGPAYPATCVSWNDVRGTGGFVEKLNAYLVQTNQPGAGKFRLPTEAEWERAARGGTSARFSFGDALAGDDGCGANADADPYAWWCGNDSPYGIQPAGAKKPNPYGLLDVHGNAWEWVEDWYGAYGAAAATNPAGPTTGTYRVVRGGGWGDSLSLARSAQRNGAVPSDRANGLGFRLARTN